MSNTQTRRRCPVPLPSHVLGVLVHWTPREATVGLTRATLPGPTLTDIARALDTDDTRVRPVLADLMMAGVLTTTRFATYTCYQIRGPHHGE